MVWIGCVLVVIGFIIIYLALPGGKLWTRYIEDIKLSYSTTNQKSASLNNFSKEEIAELPALLQKHIINGGYIGKPKMSNMSVHFHNTKFRLSPGKNPINIEFQQVNFAQRPDRHAFLSGRIAGIPLQAKDSILDGYGSMTGVLAKQFQLFQSTGAEMNQGQLITVLADAVLMPSLFLQDFVSWTEIDAYTIEGEISWKDVAAKGKFTFNDDGDIIRFDTNDRYMDDGKANKLVPWHIIYGDYKEQNGYWQPGNVQVNWLLPDGVNTYFVSDDIEIIYSVNAMNL